MGTSPYGIHQPLLGSTCINGYGDGQSTGFDGYAYHLPNGTAVGPSSPGYINMKAACYGFGGVTGGGTTDPASLREYAPGMGQIYSLQNIANSAYSAFQASLREVSGPLTLGVAYTYSHSIDDASDRSDATFVNSFDIESNRASSAFDERHLLHVSYIYELPILKGMRGLLDWFPKDPGKDWKSDKTPSKFGGARTVKYALDGWQLSGLTSFESGIPSRLSMAAAARGLNGILRAG